jgi:hypothetical protein
VKEAQVEQADEDGGELVTVGGGTLLARGGGLVGLLFLGGGGFRCFFAPPTHKILLVEV